MTPDAIRAAAYVVAHEIRRHRRDRTPVPRWLLDLDREVSAELSALGHRAVPTAEDAPPLKSAEDVAADIGCSVRTVRRRAAQLGGHKIAGHWVFPT
ncbi:hypothetical protein [Nocardia cyriacigeorgica]|uniref:hypothetical protein n=1 Tax=Nocardia cyriacigeorgica TaxID=135487 RepID=UPI000CEA254D|nr:hypothetical protein [Nocardia cyriacigeorgica]AVH21173.1 hypothetical protein C5B73_06510 [Nocardia cyriacigeorgica]MBF6286912.1 hypothetical protein [Nocardia cyriacigeorgica]PPJ07598.1 hypothetical protein C5E43_18135 [Nocardia cyriacigeorgica]